MKLMIRILLVMLPFLAFAAPAQAAEDHAQFYEREYDEGERFRIELALTLLGMQDDEVDGIFDEKSITSIKQFQKEIFVQADGYLTREQFKKLQLKSEFLSEKMGVKYFRDAELELYYPIPLKLVENLQSSHDSSTFRGSSRTGFGGLMLTIRRASHARFDMKKEFEMRKEYSNAPLVYSSLSDNQYAIYGKNKALRWYDTAVLLDNGDLISMEITLIGIGDETRQHASLARFLMHSFAPIHFSEPAPHSPVNKDYFGDNFKKK